MIARLWRGLAAPATADAYEDHFTRHVAPALAALAGHRGAWLLRRDAGGQVEFLAVTLWESRDSIRAFAGDDIEAAVVEPEARAVLAAFEEVARHFEVVSRTGT
ncbi:antibiotic biosynthesis monooxygenase [Vineibacter terrae]|uniref:Antibiotic biosynthesis monooxygenase n=1 Tax=Vineibacter terrae TaxID=2586908 RepID=A0A5C8PEQ5_9HYPH|nr:antibiotic biosynthesis monooxygenase [Vineibacter terrae]TXL71634.1 antibiotic biosynthesis monooxygenase [Vineibacter terrae]